MHSSTIVLTILVLLVLLAAALVKTCIDLRERGPYEAPFLEDDGRGGYAREHADTDAGSAAADPASGWDGQHGSRAS